MMLLPIDFVDQSEIHTGLEYDTREFSCDKDLFTRNARCPDSLSNGALRPVVVGGIQMPIANLQGRQEPYESTLVFFVRKSGPTTQTYSQQSLNMVVNSKRRGRNELDSLHTYSWYFHPIIECQIRLLRG